MADVDTVKLLIGQCKVVLRDHPYNEDDPMSYLVEIAIFPDELKFIIKALEDLHSRMSFDEIEVIK